MREYIVLAKRWMPAFAGMTWDRVR
jgi:hypothetical protein